MRPLVIAALALYAGEVSAAELGAVRWGRDLAAAKARAAESGRPLLILFDEVPGCATVKRYGEEVLTHPLIVEAIESLFEPLAILNNVEGPDRVVLEAYREPAWNNPVVRFARAGGETFGPRVAGDYTVAALAAGMREALAIAGRKSPGYLDALAARGEAEARFAMHCFWSGEAAIATIPGVARTEAGFSGGREVVVVRYDPRRVGFASLLSKARGLGQADAVFAAGEDGKSAAALGVPVLTPTAFSASPKDDKYHLKRSLLRFVPMSPEQTMCANSALALSGDPLGCLSPRQLRIFDRVRAAPERAAGLGSEGADLGAALVAAERSLSAR